MCNVLTADPSSGQLIVRHRENCFITEVQSLHCGCDRSRFQFWSLREIIVWSSGHIYSINRINALHFVPACKVCSLSNDYSCSSVSWFYMQLHWQWSCWLRVHRVAACLMMFSYVWEWIWPSLLCDCDFIKGVCFCRMAESQKKLKKENT